MASLFVVVLGVSGVVGMQAATAAPASPKSVQVPPPSGNNGTTIDPLQYNCGNDAPTCGQVGESNGYYNGTNVDLLYSGELLLRRQRVLGGHRPAARPAPGRRQLPARRRPATGTSLGNTTHGDTLYIPVPLFSNPPPDPVHRHGDLHRPSTDHRPVPDRRRRCPGNPSPSSVSNVPIPAHDHVVGTRNSGCPEWWNVEVVATTSPSTFSTLTSVAAINAAVRRVARPRRCRPTRSCSSRCSRARCRRPWRPT